MAARSDVVSLTVMSDQPEKEQEQSPEFQRFDSFMKKLANVPVSEVRKLEAEQKQAKVRKVKRDRASENKKA